MIEGESKATRLTEVGFIGGVDNRFLPFPIGMGTTGRGERNSCVWADSTKHDLGEEIAFWVFGVTKEVILSSPPCGLEVVISRALLDVPLDLQIRRFRKAKI